MSAYPVKMELLIAFIILSLTTDVINIDTMTNRSKKDNAYTVLDVESDVAEETLDKIRAIDGVIRVRSI